MESTNEVLSERSFRATRQYMNWDIDISITQYADNAGGPAIILYAADTEHNKRTDIRPGEPIAVASVNTASMKVREGEVVIKDYSENRGILAFLRREGVISETGRSMPLGHAYGVIARLER
jgi:hypothetical protein